MLTILSPGNLTLIQDLGRPGFAHLGVSRCGAADPISLRIGNALIGNAPGAPAIEMTLVGPTLRFEASVDFVLMGADLWATLDDVPLKIGEPVRARSGQVFKTAAAGRGCRCYLCLAANLEIPKVLGSTSTHLDSQLGGFHGRRLMTGDELRFRPRKRRSLRRLNSRILELLNPSSTLRATDSVHTASFTADALGQFYRSEYHIRAQSSRLGLRLDGPPIPNPGEVLTTGVSLGTIQIPPSGQPIILFVDQQTTGGYPQIACVATVDHFRIGQLRPGDPIRFQRISFGEARDLYLAQETLLDEFLA